MRDPSDAPSTGRAGCSTGWSSEACAREGVRYELEHYWRVPPTPFSPDVVGAIETRGPRHRQRLSPDPLRRRPRRAVHGAIGPTGMVFVPSRGGRSHCEEEFTPIEDIEHGANTLLGAAAELAGQA